MPLFNKLKQFKLAHWVYNLFHYKMLLHNKAAYKKYNIHKPLVASISSKDFPDKESQAWLDKGYSKELVQNKPYFSDFSEGLQQQILLWSDNGYLILKGLIEDTTVQSVNEEIDKLVSKKKIHFTHDNKLMFANRVSPL